MKPGGPKCFALLCINILTHLPLCLYSAPNLQPCDYWVCCTQWVSLVPISTLSFLTHPSMGSLHLENSFWANLTGFSCLPISLFNYRGGGVYISSVKSPSPKNHLGASLQLIPRGLSWERHFFTFEIYFKFIMQDQRLSASCKREGSAREITILTSSAFSATSQLLALGRLCNPSEPPCFICEMRIIYLPEGWALLQLSFEILSNSEILDSIILSSQHISQ